MGLLGFRLSRAKKVGPEQPGDGDFLRQFQDLQVVVEEQERTIRELTTGLQRIERKQNRWLQILNLDSKDLEKIAQGVLPAQPEDTAVTAPLGAAPGPGGNGQAGDTEYE